MNNIQVYLVICSLLKPFCQMFCILPIIFFIIFSIKMVLDINYIHGPSTTRVEQACERNPHKYMQL